MIIPNRRPLKYVHIVGTKHCGRLAYVLGGLVLFSEDTTYMVGVRYAIGQSWKI
jgi:hypothetical protein